MTKTYHGWRENRTAVVKVEEEDGAMRELPLRLDLDNHSPDGFEWGYGGSGPAQLALALLADALGDDHVAVLLHQRFKWKFIVPIHQSQTWRMTEHEVRDKAALVQRELPNFDFRLDTMRGKI